MVSDEAVELTIAAERGTNLEAVPGFAVVLAVVEEVDGNFVMAADVARNA
jgi:hypothetical protein